MNTRYAFFSLFLLTVILAFTSATVRAHDINGDKLVNHYSTLTLAELSECQILSDHLGFDRQVDIIVNLLDMSIMAEVVSLFEVAHEMGYYQGVLDTTIQIRLSNESVTEEALNGFFVKRHNNMCMPKTEI